MLPLANVINLFTHKLTRGVEGAMPSSRSRFAASTVSFSGMTVPSLPSLDAHSPDAFALAIPSPTIGSNAVGDATVQFLDTRHFALETHVEEIAAAMQQFLAKTTAWALVRI